MNTDTIRKNATFFAKYMFDDINAPIHSSKFHNALKEADIVPGDKKERKISRENYRSISILPNVSNVYERCLYDQMSDFLIISFQSISVVFERVTAHNTVF